MSIQDDIFDVEHELKDSDVKDDWERIKEWAFEMEKELTQYHKLDRDLEAFKRVWQWFNTKEKGS